jgi:hypothetical protein
MRSVWGRRERVRVSRVGRKLDDGQREEWSSERLLKLQRK